MTDTLTLQDVADAVVRRAERQGFVVPRDIREETVQAGLPESSWKEVLELARHGLNYKHGRYYHVHTVSERMQQEQDQQQLVHSAIRQIVQHHRQQSRHSDRREQDRMDFIQSATIQTDDDRSYRVLTRDISTSGIRLLGTKSFLGQRVRVTLPKCGNSGPWTFWVRILWTCTVADEMFENGGMFLELISDESSN